MKRRRFVQRMTAAAIFMFAGSLSGGQKPSEDATGGPRDPAVDAVFSDLERWGPGAAVVVMRGGELVHRAGYGIAHLDHDIPITPETVFDIASISKQFGAMAALLLEADGKLDFDAPVQDLVPELPDFDATITVRHLVHHTSGIRDWPHTMALGGVEMSDVISFEKILRMLFQQRDLNFPPGSEYAYSNTGYNLLALVIERASGMTFRAFTQARIFEPLGMTHTHFSDSYTEVVPGRAESYAPSGTEGGRGFQRQPNQLTALASSSLLTTIDDFALWMRNYETAQVGGPEIIERMTQRGILTSGDTIAYAHGLRVDEYRGLPTFGHGGSWAGYRTRFLRFPGHDLSIAVFCNISTCDPAGRAQAVAEVYLEDVVEPATEAAPSTEEPEGPDLTEAQLSEYVGEYRSPELDTSYNVHVNSGRLVAEHWRNSSSFLSPMGDDTFRGDRWWFPEVRFVRDAEGRVTGFTVTGTRVRNLVFERR